MRTAPLFPVDDQLSAYGVLARREPTPVVDPVSTAPAGPATAPVVDPVLWMPPAGRSFLGKGQHGYVDLP